MQVAIDLEPHVQCVHAVRPFTVGVFNPSSRSRLTFSLLNPKKSTYTKNETHCHSSLTEWSETRGLQDYPLSQFTCYQDMWCQLLELEANLEIE